MHTYSSSNDSSRNREFNRTVSGECEDRATGQQRGRGLCSAEELQQNRDSGCNECHAIDGELQRRVLNKGKL